MSDRCSCVDGPNYRCGIGRPCDVHGDVDALMAWGEYVDRRGVEWRRCECVAPACGMWHDGHPSSGVAPAQMRLRIVREQHREVCPGLHDCDDHPVPHVVRWPKRFEAFHAREDFGSTHPTFAEAIDAAQQLAKETP